MSRTYEKMRPLTDVLAVVVVLSALIAILAPALAQQQKRRLNAEAACLSNLRQIGMATRLYTEDYDGTLFPQKTDAPNPFAGKVGVSQNAAKHTFFNQLLDPYARNYNVWKCPANLDAWVNADKRGQDTIAAYRGYGGQNSYGANLYLYPGGKAMKVSAISEPAKTVMLADARYYGALPKTPPPAEDVRTSGEYAQHWKNIGNSYFHRAKNEKATPPTDAEAERLGKARHKGQIHVLLVDGQVKPLPYSAVASDAGLWRVSR